MTIFRRLSAITAGALILTATLAGSASAEGFVERTLEEIEEFTATCDFDGDGVFTDYWALDRDQQTVLQKTNVQVDARGFTHVKIITVFDNVAYGETPEGPPFLYNSGTGTMNVLIDPDGVLQSVSIRGGNGLLTDAVGDVLYQGPGNFDFVIDNGEPVDFIQRGRSGPCVPGID